MIYSFYEAGSIPGVPGTFAHCTVEVREDGTLDIKPFGGLSAEVAIPETGQVVTSGYEAPVPIEESTSSEVVQEPAQPAPTPFFKEG